MLRIWARMPLVLFVSLLAGACLGLPREPGAEGAPLRAGATVQGTVYIARNLSPDNFAVLSAALGRDPSAVLLLDTPSAAPANKAFLAALKPARVVPVGDYSEEIEDLEHRLGCRPETPHHWTRRVPRSLWQEFYPQAPTVVVCPSQPQGLLLQAACLAGVLKAPLFVRQGNTTDGEELAFLLRRWQTAHVCVAGSDNSLPAKSDLRVTHLKNEQEVAEYHRRRLAAKSAIHTLVVANPFDGKADNSRMSALAPWIALKHGSGLVLTSKDGTNVDEAVHEAVKTKELRRVESVILAGDLEALPVVKKNPIPADKDELIEMEPLTPLGTEPITFSVGRLFHADPGIVTLLLERPALIAKAAKKPSALVVSNAGGGLPLLETISRHTVREMTNAGYDTKVMMGNDVKGEDIRREMPKHDIFLWEGHHNTIIRDWKFPEWDEPLLPSLVFLQSCLALRESKVDGVFRRGAIGVIGSSTRTYSASGGATAQAFFDAVLHENLSTGEALRNAKNFMLAYMLLKESRLGDDAKRKGANQRAAWAFTLWGDPTVKLPRGAVSDQKTPAVRQSVKSNVITVHLPAIKLDPVHSDKYHAETYANARLAGLLGKNEKGDEGKALQAMVFVEVALPKAPAGKKPKLSSKLPSKNWVFNWDSRRKVGYLLAVPREKDKEELQFVYHWEDGEQQAAIPPMTKAARE